MLHLLEPDALTNPRLVFSSPEHLVPGVVVEPVDFVANQAYPPFQATYFQVLPQCETPLDYHQEQEVWIVLNGSGILTYEGVFYFLNAQDIFFFASFKQHQIRNHTQLPLLICSIYW
ncbi:Cupin domain [Legionella steigerwaltii]|uniref:Cupin domain n=1 Tax=Legionella steigerwaltii TaxID=460 RepID=A0A378L3V0_9GAMM|nr:cupin domain-containing protein [Legionella steigerwaltii]KTD69922.1 Cupin domain protein [Legionella steigerwaltii]STY21765.1 Cupin domain [Legionella steigerwaltii]